MAVAVCFSIPECFFWVSSFMSQSVIDGSLKMFRCPKGRVVIIQGQWHCQRPETVRLRRLKERDEVRFESSVI